MTTNYEFEDAQNDASQGDPPREPFDSPPYAAPGGITSIGFTGTRRGMTTAQRDHVQEKLLAWRPLEVHHGDALGADAEFHEMVRTLLPDTKIVTHPPSNPKQRAFCQSDEQRPEEDYLARNKSIVRASHLVLAMPGENTEQLRSGTWSAVRLCRKSPVWFMVILPNGQALK
jgi:hypothetical protein